MRPFNLQLRLFAYASSSLHMVRELHAEKNPNFQMEEP